MQARRVNTASWLGALARPPQPELLAPHARSRLTSAPPLRLPTIATLFHTTRPNPAVYNTLCLQNPHKLICGGTVKPIDRHGGTGDYVKRQSGLGREASVRGGAVAHGCRPPPRTVRPPPRTVRPPKAETQRRPNLAKTTASAHRYKMFVTEQLSNSAWC